MFIQFLFIIFSTFFWLLDSCLDLIEFFKCMIWQSIFLLFFFHSHDLSAPSNDAYPRWTSSLKHLFSYEDRFERVSLWFEVYHFCPNRGLWLKSVFEKWVILVNMPQGINQRWFQDIAILGFCVFAQGKGLAGLKAIASLDAYQITNYQFLQKFIFSFA